MRNYLINQKRNQKIDKVFKVLFLFGILLLAYFIIFLSPKVFIYDEILFVKNIPILVKFGFGKYFLLNLIDQAPGPLYQLFHVLFKPITVLDPIRMRVLNYFLFIILIFIGCEYINKNKGVKSMEYLLVLLSVPLLFPIVGMSLTEMPAMVFLFFSLLLFQITLKSDSSFSVNLIIISIAGVFMSLAIAGRTQFLVILIPVFIFFFEKKNRFKVIFYTLLSLSMPVYMFWIWKGLTPPYIEDLNNGINISFGLLALSYLSIMIFFVSYSWFDFTKKTLMFAILISFLFTLINILFKFLEFEPFKMVLFSSFKSPFLIDYYKYIAPGILMIPVVLFFKSSLNNIILYSEDNWRLFLFFSIVLITLTSIKTTHQFSSRYVAQSFPLIILLLHSQIKINHIQLVISTTGLIIGFSSLYSYYTFPF